MGLDGKVVIVTGGASGIGRASALLLGRHGGRIVIADRDASKAAAVRAEVDAAGAAALDCPVDVSSSTDVDRLVDRAVSAFGRIDVLVHCAGICPRQPVLEMSDEEWRTVIRVNLDGSFYVTRAVGRVMAAQRAGTMILLTSDRGVYGSADYAHYAASKGGLIALTKSLAIALGRSGVTVNGLNPGMTDTPLARGAITAEGWRQKEAVDVLGTHSRPEEIAEIVLFLAGPAGTFMTGQIVATRMRTTA
jgi:3-oxoacyl-[acyl-carrier protein] reductase